MDNNNDIKPEESQVSHETQPVQQADVPHETSESPPRKMYDEMDFFEMMEENVNDFHTRKGLVESVIRNAQKGDAASLRVVEKVLLETKYKNDQKLIVNDDQLRNIITLAADRIRGQGPLNPRPTTFTS